MESNDGIFNGFFSQSFLDHFEECFGFFHSINYHLTTKEPMAGMFRVGLAHVEAFNISWVALQFFLLGNTYIHQLNVAPSLVQRTMHCVQSMIQ